MPVLRPLLLLPLLSPLLAVLVVASLNPRPWVSLRLLTWSSAPLPLGAWIALAGAGGAALSVGATSLALGEGTAPLRRQVRRRLGREAPESWDEQEAPPSRWERSEPASPAWGSAGSSRAAGEPSPTVAVPFRVIRRGGSTTATGVESDRSREARREPMPETVPAGDGWEAAASDDW